ncbi:response regulator [Fluviispira multicolorata]|nr:response regulator [Fluviispira multicolorata]
MKANSLKALIVEDQENFRNTVAEMLNFLGFETSTAEDGQKGIEKSNSCKFDLIISDIRMPNKDGRWFLNEVRKVNKNYPPFIFMSGYADFAVCDAYQEGADAFISKPPIPEKLEHIVTILCSPHSKRWSKASSNINQKHNNNILKKFSNSVDDPGFHQVIVGRGGIFLQIEDYEFELDEIVSFDLNFSSGPIAFLKGNGRVVWKIEEDYGVPSKHGIFFEYLEPKTSEIFLNYLAKKDFVAVIPNGK